MTITYTIEITPLENLTTYAAAVDVTEFAILQGLPTIKRDIDKGDFEIGVFNYQSLNIKFNNDTGIFSGPDENGKSIFPIKRDNAKLKITFVNDTGSEASFEGLITDKSTIENENKREITFTILSFDSIFSKLNVDSGSILDNVLFSEAFRVILSGNTKITNILNYSDSNINPTLDLRIDEGSEFDRLTIKKALDKLLIASNSVLLIDSSNNIVVRSREENSNTPHELFLNDTLGRDNIDSIDKYNNGKQRMFNTIIINETESKDNNSIDINDSNQQTFTLDFITDRDKELTIGSSFVAGFSLPKKELLVTIDRDLFDDLLMFNRFILDINIHTVPQNEEYPMYGYMILGIDKSPFEVSGLKIHPTTYFKVISISEQMQNFKYILKLRDTGKTI